jgi:hypothetical protein
MAIREQGNQEEVDHAVPSLYSPLQALLEAFDYAVGFI